MNIVHRIGVGSPNSEIISSFKPLGIELGEGFNSFELSESDQNWPEVKLLLERFKLFDSVYTKFSEAEIVSARQLLMVSAWHHQYPEPSEDFGYLHETYHAESNPYHCVKCGIGAMQYASFSMKKEPAWGGKNILQLNWVFDEFFVKPSTFNDFFRLFGIECRPVMAEGSGGELKSVVQLVIPDRAVLAGMDRFASKVCSVCNREKYLPIVKGYRPRPIELHADIAKSEQYFGDGGSASRKIVVSHKFYAAAKEYGLKGVRFEPCESNEFVQES